MLDATIVTNKRSIPAREFFLGLFTTPLGADAAKVYEQFVEAGEGPRDFSGVIRFIRGG